MGSNTNSDTFLTQIKETLNDSICKVCSNISSFVYNPEKYLEVDQFVEEYEICQNRKEFEIDYLVENNDSQKDSCSQGMELSGKRVLLMDGLEATKQFVCWNVKMPERFQSLP